MDMVVSESGARRPSLKQFQAGWAVALRPQSHQFYSTGQDSRAAELPDGAMAPWRELAEISFCRSALSAHRKREPRLFRQGHDIHLRRRGNLTRLEASPRLLAPVSTAPKRRSDRAHGRFDEQLAGRLPMRAQLGSLGQRKDDDARIRQPRDRAAVLQDGRIGELAGPGHWLFTAAKFGVHCPSKSTSIRARILAKYWTG